jgi:hypothetical protein
MPRNPTRARAGLELHLEALVPARGSHPFEADGLETHADPDGIVCINAVHGELSAADGLRVLLADAFGTEWGVSMIAIIQRWRNATPSKLTSRALTTCRFNYTN